MNILIAEDNADDVVLLEHAFAKAGFAGRLNTVSDGVEALDYMNGQGAFADRGTYPFPDIVLLDLNMPRKNGFEVLNWIRNHERYRRLIVHVLTASSRPADVDQAYELYASSYAIKPTRLDQLVAYVAALLEWHSFITRARVVAPKEHPETSSRS